MPLTISIRFAEIRDLTERVMAFYAQETGTNQQELSSCYEVDCDGVDAEALLIRFRKQFQVDFNGFRFEDYFYNEGEWSMSAGVVLMIPATLRWLVVMGIRVVSRPAADRLTAVLQKIVPVLRRLSGMRSEPKSLTLGDLITAAAVGKFVTRSEVKLALV